MLDQKTGNRRLTTKLAHEINHHSCYILCLSVFQIWFLLIHVINFISNFRNWWEKKSIHSMCNRERTLSCAEVSSHKILPVSSSQISLPVVPTCLGVILSTGTPKTHVNVFVKLEAVLLSTESEVYSLIGKHPHWKKTKLLCWIIFQKRVA